MSVAYFFTSKTKDDTAGLAYACALAATHDKPLRVICALPDLANSYTNVAPEFGYVANAVVPQTLLEDQQNLVTASKAAFEEVVAASPLSRARASISVRYGFLPHIAGEEAVLTDMTVFPADAGKSSHMYGGAFLHVLMEARLPVMLAGAKPVLEGPVILAWDGSEPAARSVRFNLPLLSAAREVVIVHGPEKLRSGLQGEARSPTALATWLGAQDIQSRQVSLSGDVGQGILDTAKAIDAGAIVLGAYGHSRLGQYLFGGVTRTLLRASEKPALALCH